MGNCVICNTELTQIEQIFRARLFDVDGKRQADRIQYQSWCIACEIYLFRTDQGQKTGNWQISNVKENELAIELSESDFAELMVKIELQLEKDEFNMKRKQWIDFLKVKKQNDKIYRFIRTDQDYIVIGYVIKRKHYFISDYVEEVKKID
jgi:hypothetical protein